MAEAALERLGSERYVRVNRRLQELAARHRPLIVVHRGSGTGSIAENTALAFTAALRQGADIIETDVIASTDGEFFLFHNGYERLHFGMDEDIRNLSAVDLRAQQYEWCRRSGTEPYGLEPLETILTGFSGTIFNVDRSWGYWPELLDHMKQYDVTDRMLLKSPVQDDALERLARCSEPFPFMPIVKTTAELENVLRHADINTVVVELIARDADSELADPAVITEMHDRGILVMLNAINLSDRRPLFAGWDEEVSLTDGPEHGWGRLISHGADLVQTDWPAPLRDFRARLGGRKSE